MPAPEPPSPRERSRLAFGIVGFAAGVVTVVLVVLLLRRLGVM